MVSNMKKIKHNDLKTFALIWSFIFLVVSLWPLLNNGNIRVWGIVVALIFVTIAFKKPLILSSFYKIWVRFGEVIGGVISKVIMMILFYVMFTPISFVLKLLGKDLLNKKIDKNASTYWVTRETQPGSLKNQY